MIGLKVILYNENDGKIVEFIIICMATGTPVKQPFILQNFTA